MTASARKIILLGLAGIGWDDLAARLKTGQVPAIAAVIARGGAGRLISSVPPSGWAFWATIATGLSPHRHGILRPEESWAGGIRPTGHASWRADPAWLRLADAGLATASVAWPATAPGEAWPGLHVDSRFFAPSGRRFEDWLVPPGSAPTGWVERLRELRVHPADIGGDALAPFVPALGAIDQDRDHRLVDLAVMITRLSGIHAAAGMLIGSAPWDALFVHYPFLEHIQLRFGAAGPPFDRVVDAGWLLLDQLIGATVRMLPPDTTILLVSPGKPGAAGVVIAAGPDVARAPLRGLSAIDIAPTLLAHFGLRDPALPGRAFLPAAGPLRPAPDMRLPIPAVEPDPADIARVAAFGHRPPHPPPGWHARLLTAQAELVLPADPATAGQLADAALAVDSNLIAAIGLRAAAHVATGEAEPLPALADRIAALAPGHLWEQLIRAGHHALRGEASLAQPFLTRVEKEGGAEDRLRAAAAWMMLDWRADAARLFEGVLAQQPDNVPALLGLAMARLPRPLEAEPHLRRVLDLDPHHAAARQTLVALLRNTGRAGEAERLTG